MAVGISRDEFYRWRSQRDAAERARLEAELRRIKRQLEKKMRDIICLERQLEAAAQAKAIVDQIAADLHRALDEERDLFSDEPADTDENLIDVVLSESDLDEDAGLDGVDLDEVELDDVEFDKAFGNGADLDESDTGGALAVQQVTLFPAQLQEQDLRDAAEAGHRKGQSR